MREDFELKGEWFFPGTPEHKVYGNLKFSPNNRTSLEIIGSLSNNFLIDLALESKIILGVSTKGKLITLYDCQIEKQEINFSGNEVSIISITFIFVGMHFNKHSDIVFKCLRSELFNLNEWLGMSGFKVRTNSQEDFKLNLKYNLPKTIEFPIDNKVKGRFTFAANVQSTGAANAFNIKQTAQLVIEALDTEYEFMLLLNYLTHFQDLLTLGSYTASYPISIRLESDLYTKRIKDKIYRNQIELYYSPTISNGSKQKFLQDFLFNYIDIKPHFKRIINKWYSNKEELNIVNKLLLESFYQKRIFTENNFLNIVHSLETFHRRARPNNVVPKEIHTKRIELIKKSVPIEYLEWLNMRLMYSNEPSLHQRLEALIKEFNTKTFDKIVKDKGQLIKQTKDSRNYYTHYDKSGKKKALKGSELFFLTEKLKIVVISAILKENGFSKSLIERLLSRNEYTFFNHIIER